MASSYNGDTVVFGHFIINGPTDQVSLTGSDLIGNSHTGVNVPLSDLAIQFDVPISFGGLLEGRIAYGHGFGAGTFGTHSGGVFDASASFSFEVLDATYQAVNGAGITGDSGTVYAVSQVPEPSPRSALLMVMILLWIGTRWANSANPHNP